MSRLCIATVLLLAVSAGAQAQQVFRIVGPDGKVTYSDRPAPATTASAASSASVVETPARPPVVDTAALPYELRLVAQRYPVTLYTSAECNPCADARSLLRGRGVPFVEKTVSTAADAEALTRLSGSTSLPFASIGAQQLKGYSSTEWSQYLDLAGYPRQSQLPPNYRAPIASPLVVVASPPRPAAAAPAARPQGPTPAAPSRNPAGIQF